MSFWAIPTYAVIFGCAILILLAIRRSHRRQDAFFQSFLSSGRGDSKSDSSSIEVQQHLVECAVIKGALLARAASESFLKTKEIPDGIVIITRQTQIESLRTQGLWDKLSLEEGDLLRAPDGYWTPEQIQQMVSWCEQLRLLRWVLGLDGEITPLAFFPRTDVSLSAEIVKHGRALFDGKELLNSWDIRVERDIAREYLVRCLIEWQSRESIHASREFAEWAAQARVQVAGPSDDLLAGVKAVGELENDELAYLQLIAGIRENFSDYLIDQVSTDRPIDFLVWSKTR